MVLEKINPDQTFGVKELPGVYSRQHWYRLLRAGLIPASQPGGRGRKWRIRGSDLQQFLADRAA